MAFSKSDVGGQVTETVSASMMFNASGQGIIETKLAQVGAPWSEQINQHLGKMATRVLDWRENSGYLRAWADLPADIIRFAEAMQQAKAKAALLPDEDTAENRRALAAIIGSVQERATILSEWSTGYQSALQSVLKGFSNEAQALQTLVEQIQARENQIAAEIVALNQQMKNLRKQIDADRRAIAKAHAAERRATKEMIIGVVLAPLTGGASLILAGIGAVSFKQAEEEVSSLRSLLSRAARKISSDASALSEDKRQAAVLHGVVLSAHSLLDAVRGVQVGVEQLVITWSMFETELTGAKTDLEGGSKADAFVVAKLWLDVAADVTLSAAEVARNLLQEEVRQEYVTTT